MKKVLFWPYRFLDMKLSWVKQVQWLAKSLQKEGYQILQHPKFICSIPNAKVYDFRKDTNIDITIYNHATVADLVGDIVESKRNWFFKPTVPDEVHTTLDELGYGPYSSITYQKPNFENYSLKDVDGFFKTKVKDWINNKSNKWGSRFKTKEVEIKQDDYYLVLGQCGGDSVVTTHDFGNYWQKLESIVRELNRVGDKPIVVKLHPHTDGKDAKNINFSKSIGERLIKIGKKVTVYIGKGNLHKFIEKANCVLLANSGSGYETMMQNKPIISWGTPEYVHITYPLRHLCDLKRALKLDWFNREKSDKFLYWYLEQYCYFDQESCDRRVKELLCLQK